MSCIFPRNHPKRKDNLPFFMIRRDDLTCERYAVSDYIRAFTRILCGGMRGTQPIFPEVAVAWVKKKDYFWLSVVVQDHVYGSALGRAPFHLDHELILDNPGG
jgi:hypothetical protein